MPKSAEKEDRIWKALMKRAYNDGGFSADLSSYAEALSTRIAIYKALQRYIRSTLSDELLDKAISEYSIGVKKDSTTLIIQRRKSLLVAERFAEAFNFTDEELKSPDEEFEDAKAAESLKLVEATLSKQASRETPSDPLMAPNPFFKRD